MRKHLLYRLLLIFVLFFVTQVEYVLAEEKSAMFQVEIVSPEQITEYPGKDLLIKASVKNITDRELHDVFTYITMANISKTWTVNLEDYSADQPIIIGTMKPKEERVIELPIKLVYSADYYLYTSVLSKESNIITSSQAIPVKIIGNTKIVPLQVQVVSISIPLLLLLALIMTINRRNAK